MKKNFMKVIFLCLSLCLVQQAAFAEVTVVPAWLIGIGKNLLSKGLKYIGNKLWEEVKSYIIDDPVPDVDYVEISENSLNRIRYVVRNDLIRELDAQDMRNAHAEVLTLLRSIRGRLQEYQWNLAAGMSAAQLSTHLELLNTDTYTLEHHKAFQSTFNSKYWLNLPDYELAAGLRYTVLLEMYTQGLRYSLGNVVNMAEEMRGHLQSMLDAMQVYYMKLIVFRTNIYNDYENMAWSVEDTITGRVYVFDRYNTTGNPVMAADAKYYELIGLHIGEFLGDAGGAITPLRSLADPYQYGKMFDKDFISYWTFDKYITSGTTRNYSALGRYNNPAAPINNTTAYSRPGLFGQGIEFNGSGYLQVPYTSNLDIGTGDMSVACWVKTTKTTGINTILDKRSSSSIGYHMCLYQGRILFQLSGANLWGGTASPSLADGAWHLVVVTIDRDSATGLKIYCDGVLLHTFDCRSYAASLTNTAPLFIGGHKDSSSSHFNGMLDELRIYSRVLTPSQVDGLRVLPNVF